MNIVQIGDKFINMDNVTMVQDWPQSEEGQKPYCEIYTINSTHRLFVAEEIEALRLYLENKAYKAL